MKPAATPTPITIYELYAKYAKPPPKGILSDSPTRPREKYVPGTLKSWDNRYYYIRATDKDKYYELCKALFTKGQAGSLEQKIQENRAEIETLKTLQAAPAPPPP